VEIKSTDTFDHLFFDESVKLESVWDHAVNMKFNVFFILISTFFTSMVHAVFARRPT